MRILVLCTGNSARSQMAEALFRHEIGAGDQVFSAGVKPGSVRPEAIAVMGELGIDISGHRSKPVDEFAGQAFDYVITVCDNARDNCPVFPGAAARIQPTTFVCSVRSRKAALRSRTRKRYWWGVVASSVRCRRNIDIGTSRSRPRQSTSSSAALRRERLAARRYK